MAGNVRVSGAGFAADPSPTLEDVFRRIQRDRMAGLALLNPALAVEAVGFERRAGCWGGVLITPWFMSWLLLPLAGGPWLPLAAGESRIMRFPAGPLEFMGAFEPELGEYQSCSLFSPPDFADQHGARLAALKVIGRLYAPPERARPGRSVGRAPDAPMTKREFLRGAFLRGKGGR